MRALIAKPLWFQKVGSMSVDDDGDLELSDVLAVAAFSVADEGTSLEIGMAISHAVEDAATHRTYGGAHEYVLALLDHLINNETKVN